MIDNWIIQTLIKQARKRRIVTNEYLDDANDPNYKLIKRLHDLNDADTAIFNSWCWMWSTVATTYQTFVWSPKIVEWVTIDFDKLIEDYIALWFCCLWLEKKNNIYHIFRLPAHQYFFDEVHTVVYAYESYDMNKIQNYYLVTKYYPGYNENKLYKCDTIYDIGKQTFAVPLSSIPETSNLSEIEQTNLSQPALFLLDSTNNNESTSIIDKIVKLIYSIDRRIVQIDLNLVKNVENFILMKGIRLPISLEKKYYEWDTTVLSYKDLPRTIITDNDQASIEFVENRNALLDTAIAYEEKQIRKISSLSLVPVDFLWLETAHWAIWQGSRTILHSAFIKRIIEIRNSIDIVLSQIQDIIGVDFVRVRWDVFEKNKMELVQELSTALTNNLISRKKSIEYYQWIDEDQAEEELATINEENRNRVVVTPKN